MTDRASVCDEQLKTSVLEFSILNELIDFHLLKSQATNFQIELSFLIKIHELSDLIFLNENHEAALIKDQLSEMLNKRT